MPRFISCKKLTFASRCFRQPTLESCLYHSPYFSTLAQLDRFARRLEAADARWNDLRRFPDSAPARYVRSLNVNRLRRLSFPSGTNIAVRLELNGAIARIARLAVGLEDLNLSAEVTLSRTAFEALLERTKLKRITGLRLDQSTLLMDSNRRDPATLLCASCPHLRSLEIWGLGSTDVGFEWDHFPQDPTLNLHELEHLAIFGLKRGLFLEGLLRVDLPRLIQLELAGYHDMPGDLTTSLLKQHGSKLLSLSIVGPPDWPTLHPPVSPSLLLDCPRLEYLALDGVLPPDPTMFSSFYDPTTGPTISASPHASCRSTQPKFDHPLRMLILPRWTSSRENPPSQQAEAFYDALVAFTPPSLAYVAVDDFYWVKRELGKAAMETGLNGKLRKLTTVLSPKAVKVIDKYGQVCPPGLVGQGSSMSGAAAAIQARRGSRGFYIPASERAEDTQDDDNA